MLGLKRQVLKTIAVRVGGRAKYFEACHAPFQRQKAYLMIPGVPVLQYVHLTYSEIYLYGSKTL